MGPFDGWLGVSTFDDPDEKRTRQGIRSARGALADPGRFEKLTKWHGDKARWVLDAWTDVWLSTEFVGWSLDEHLGSIRCPVLAIHGDRDEYGSLEFPRRIFHGVAGPAEMVILEGVGHVPHRERPEDVLELIYRFPG